MEKKTSNVPVFLCILVCLDTIGIGTILMQLMPRIVELGASPFQSGLIAAIYGAAQLFSSPYVGNLGDKMNRKNMLLIIMPICSVVYYLHGTTNLTTFIIVRFIAGLVKHTQMLSMSCLSTIVTPEEKSNYFGYFGAGLGIGFIIGPVIGGFLAELPDGFSWMCVVASLEFLISTVLVWIFLPNIENKATEKGDTTLKQRSKGIQGFLEKVGVEDCWDVLLLQTLTDFSVVIYYNNFAFEMGGYNLAPKHMGICMAVLSILGSIVSLMAGKIELLISGEKTVPYLMGIMATSFFIMSFPVSFTVYICVVGCMNISASLLRCWWPAMATSRSDPSKAGAVVGATHSLMAIVGMMAPILVGASTELFGSIKGPNYLALLVSLGSLNCYRWYPKPAGKQKVN